MANNYHDGLGRFCSRDQMRNAITEAKNSGNFEVYVRLQKDLEQADRTSNFLPSEKNGLRYDAVKNAEADIAEREQLIASGDKEKLNEWIQNRVDNPELNEMLQERDSLKKRYLEADDKHKALNLAWKKGQLEDYEVVRQQGFEARNIFEEQLLVVNQINEYKDITAMGVVNYTNLMQDEREEQGLFREYTESTLNNLEETGVFASGTREWLEQRQGGIGGSDVGKIVGVNKDWARSEREEILASKLDAITDEEVEQQTGGHTAYSGYAGRGNAWEEELAQKFAAKHPEMNITHCKTSWVNKDRPYQYANFDGLMCDENGKPNGILEIKTASDASKWGPESGGLDSVPPGYRAQVLWYCDAADFERGAIAVMIDEKDYREYHFTVTPEIRAEMESNRAKVESFVQEVADIKAGKVEDPRTPNNISGRSMFTLSKIYDAGKLKENAFKEAAIWREEPVKKTIERFKTLCPDLKDDETVREAMLKLYSEKPINERKRNFINVDIETSSIKTTKGHVLEVGISERNPQGEEVSKYSKVFGLSKRAAATSGVGATEVHGITMKEVEGRRTFSHKTEQEKILNKLKSGIMVAHNANFELSWFRQNLQGFAEAERKGEITVIDTRSLTRNILTDTENASLEKMVEHYNVPYENAHRAYNDANMMGVALDLLVKDLADKNKK